MLFRSDRIYGKDGAREMLDNFSYLIAMGAMNEDSQKTISNLIGTKRRWIDLSVQTSVNATVGMADRPMLPPASLSSLKNPIIVSPYGVFQVKKAFFSTSPRADKVPI